MWLEEIKLRDFRCFYGDHELRFSSDQKKNVTLVHAENGAGKTTLLNAMLWCFYGETTAKFEKRNELVNHDAIKKGRNSAFVEIVFEHNSNRYRARRYAKLEQGSFTERSFSIMRVEQGHSTALQAPDTFINTVIPREMAGHFLFDGEHAEVFLGEENRKSIRSAVQDILGCSLIDTAIKDLIDAANSYRRQMPKDRGSERLNKINEEIERLSERIASTSNSREKCKEEITQIDQQIADIDAKLRATEAAKELQSNRDGVERELTRAKRRESDAQDEVLRWLGENGRYIVSTRITDQTFDHLRSEETKGRIPSPYNEEFVKDLLEAGMCICGAPLHAGSAEHVKVASLLTKAANATLRSRLAAIRARVTQLRTERQKAPTKLDGANKRLADARDDISRLESELGEISLKLTGINFSEIAEREKRRNDLRGRANNLRIQIGNLNSELSRLDSEKVQLESELRKLAENDKGAKVFIAKYNFCEKLRQRLERELTEEETSARGVLRKGIAKILDDTTQKELKLNMTNDYEVSLVNDAGTQLPKSSGENQLLGLAFTAALVEFAKVRQGAAGHKLLKGTVAPLVLDSPFGQLSDSYRKTTARYIPKMAGQVVLMISKAQSSGGVLEEIQDRVGQEYLLVRHNLASRGSKQREVRQLNGKDYDTAEFDSEFDGSSIVKVPNL